MATSLRDTAEDSASCSNCGAPLHGAYCQNCGQKRQDPEDLTVRHFVQEAFEEITDLDSKVLTSFRALFFRPGFLTREYLEGRRARYLSPVKLYLFISAVYFLLAWGPSLEISGFERQLRDDPNLQALSLPKRVEREAFLEEWTEKAGHYSAYFRFLSVAGIGIALAVLYRGTKRPFGEHLIFALHYYAFDFAFNALLILGLVVAQRVSGWQAPPWTLFIAFFVLFVYFYLGLRRVHAERVGTALLKAGLLLACDFALTGIGDVSALGLSALSVLLGSSAVPPR